MLYSNKISSLKHKRNFWLLLLLAITLCRLALYIADWWICIPVLVVLSFFSTEANHSPFLWGFLSLFMLWGGYAAYFDTLNESILSNRMVQLFPLPQKGFLMVLVTALLGGLLGGFSASSGYWFRKVVAPKKEIKYY